MKEFGIIILNDNFCISQGTHLRGIHTHTDIRGIFFNVDQYAQLLCVSGSRHAKHVLNSICIDIYL